MSLQTNIVLDMYCDSLDAAELKSWVQTTYSHASNPPLLDLKCLGDYVAMAVGKSKHEEKLPSCAWDHAWTHTPLHHVTQ